MELIDRLIESTEIQLRMAIKRGQNVRTDRYPMRGDEVAHYRGLLSKLNKRKQNELASTTPT